MANHIEHGSVPFERVFLALGIMCHTLGESNQRSIVSDRY